MPRIKKASPSTASGAWDFKTERRSAQDRRLGDRRQNQTRIDGAKPRQSIEKPERRGGLRSRTDTTKAAELIDAIRNQTPDPIVQPLQLTQAKAVSFAKVEDVIEIFRQAYVEPGSLQRLSFHIDSMDSPNAFLIVTGSSGLAKIFEVKQGDNAIGNIDVKEKDRVIFSLTLKAPKESKDGVAPSLLKGIWLSGVYTIGAVKAGELVEAVKEEANGVVDTDTPEDAPGGAPQ